jgi:hypothetical protein
MNNKRKRKKKDCACEVSDRKEDSIGNWTRDHLLYSGKELIYILSLSPLFVEG